MEKAFHGRTMATLSATGSRKVQAGFEPLLTGFVRVPYNDLQALEQVAANNKNVVAVLVEPIQGEGGIKVPEDGYLPICARCATARLAADAGRSAERHRPHRKWFAHQLLGIKPDVMTLAKGLGQRRADRRLSRRRSQQRRCSGPATTARPSAAIRWPA